MTSLIRFIEDALTGTAKACPRCIGSESERIRLDGQRRPRHLLIVFIVAAHQSR